MKGMQILRLTRKAAGIALTAFSFLGGAYAQSADNMTIGNSGGRSVAYERVSGIDTAGVAVFYPAEVMRAFKDCSITQAEIGVSSKTGRDSVIVFFTRKLDGEPLYEEKFTAAKSGINNFTLTKPFVIDGDSLYIGYKIVGAYMLAYSNALTTDEEWILKKAGGWQKYDLSGDLCATMLFTVSGDALPRNNIRLSGMVMPEYSLTGTDVAFKGTAINLGADEVNSITVTYLADGKQAGTETVDGLSIAPRETGSFNLSGLRLHEEGNPEMQVVVSKVNGSDDNIPSDNASRVKAMLVRDKFEKRKTLFEFFSTERCPQCPDAHEIVEKVLGGKEDVVEVGHHAGFYTDDLTTDASLAYEWFYKTDMLYAPAVMFDRTCMADNYPSIFTDNVPLVSPSQSVVETLYGIASEAPAFVGIDMTRTLDESARSLSLDISGKQLLPYASPDSLRLFVWLTEDSIFTETQRGAVGNFWHRHSLRQSLTPVWGDKIDTPDAFTAHYEAVIPDEWDIAQMRAVAFVACVNSTDKNDCRVMNTEEIGLKSGSSSGIGQLIDDGSNGVKRIKVYDMAGVLVAECGNGCDAASLKLGKGVYIIRITAGNVTTTRKVVLE